MYIMVFASLELEEEEDAESEDKTSSTVGAVAGKRREKKSHSDIWQTSEI